MTLTAGILFNRHLVEKNKKQSNHCICASEKCHHLVEKEVDFILVSNQTQRYSAEIQHREEQITKKNISFFKFSPSLLEVSFQS